MSKIEIKKINLEKKPIDKTFYFRVYRVSIDIHKEQIFDHIYQRVDWDFLITATNHECTQGFCIHDILLRPKTEAYFLISESFKTSPYNRIAKLLNLRKVFKMLLV